MINASQDFIDALTSDNRNYRAKLLMNGSELDCAIVSLSISKGSCGSSNAFTIGNIVGTTLTAVVKELNVNVKGQKLQAQIGVLTDEENETYEFITLGEFIVSEAPQTVYQTTITAYGKAITRTGEAFIPPQVQSLANIATSIASSISTLDGTPMQVVFDSGISTSKVITASMENLTVYQALQILASVVGGYAIDTADGNIKICRFSATATWTGDTSIMRNLPVVEEEDFEILGVLCVVTPASEDEEGTPIPAVQYPAVPTGLENLKLNNQYVTEDIYNTFLATLTGYAYRPGTVTLTLGDPRLEGNDVLNVTDVNGNTYIIPCHMVTHTFDGGFNTEIVATKGTEISQDVATPGPITEQLGSISASMIAAKTSAEQARTYALEAKETTDEINAYAETAGKTVTQILNDGETAGQAAQEALDSATEAMASANSAYVASNSALSQLGIVEDIIGVLDLISKNGSYQLTQDTDVVQDKWYFARTGTAPDYVYNVTTVATTYALTEDTEIDPNKTYYTRSGTAPNYVYTPVENPVVADIGTYYEAFRNPSEQGLYELVGIDQSIQNYVSSHLVLAGNTLSLQTSGSPYRLDLTTTGMTIIGAGGTPLATYGTDTIIGSQRGFHVKIDGTELGFYDKTGSKVAYVRNDQLFIERSVVVQQMDVGTKAVDGGLGQWSWKVHEINGQNNLYLKWLG